MASEATPKPRAKPLQQPQQGDPEFWAAQQSIFVELVMHEGRFISERTSNFLLVGTFLSVAAITLLAAWVGQGADGDWRSRTQSFVIAGLGLAMSFMGIRFSLGFQRVIEGTRAAATFWRSSAAMVQERLVLEHRLATPDGEPRLPLRDGVEFFLARNRAFAKQPVAQDAHVTRMATEPEPPIPWHADRPLSPNTWIGQTLPTIMVWWWACIAVAFVALLAAKTWP
jgi:hypothetical protein